MATPVQHRRDSAADWTSNDPVLLDGQIGIESDTGKFKFGDGITAWTSLDYRNVDSVLGAITGIIQSDGAGNLSAASAGTDYAAAADVDDLVTLSGVAANSANFGTFTGDTLGDTETVKTALQTLETAVDTLIGTSGHDLVTLDVNADTLLSLSTQELGLDVQNANKVLAGPTTGADAVPAFRDLVADDIPDISAVYEPVLPAKTDKALMTLHTSRVTPIHSLNRSPLASSNGTPDSCTFLPGA
jgi:enamine deaminase RidA (YjgF/YER057c/UK114 family)